MHKFIPVFMVSGGNALQTVQAEVQRVADENFTGEDTLRYIPCFHSLNTGYTPLLIFRHFSIVNRFFLMGCNS
jgi:hypothetical protein